MNIARRVTCGAVALALLAPAVAAAQQGSPFAQLFGRRPESTGRGYTAIQFRSATGGEWAQTLEDTSLGGFALPSGFGTSVDAAVDLDHVGGRLTSSVSARGNYQRFNEGVAFAGVGGQVDAQAQVQATNRINLDFSARAARSPFYMLVPEASPELGRIIAPRGSLAARRAENDMFEAMAGVTHQYSKRSSISGWYSWREARFSTVAGADFSARGARAEWRRRMSRDFTARVGYGREQMTLSDQADPFIHELIDIGVDFLRSISVARRTALSIVTQTSVMKEAGRRRYRLNGAIDLQHRTGRTWRTSIGAQRQTEFLPGFVEPLFSDTAHIGIGGFLSKRASLNLAAYGGQSQIGFSGRDFLTYAGNARLGVALTRHFGLYTQYVYYHYQLPPDAQNAVLLQRLSRQGVSIGVQTWLPILNKENAPRDSR